MRKQGEAGFMAHPLGHTEMQYSVKGDANTSYILTRVQMYSSLAGKKMYGQDFLLGLGSHLILR